MTLNSIGVIKITFEGPLPSTPNYIDVAGLKVGDAVLTSVTPAGGAMFGPTVNSAQAIVTEDDKLHLVPAAFGNTGTYTVILIRV